MPYNELLQYYNNTNDYDYDYEQLPSVMFGDDTKEYLINLF